MSSHHDNAIPPHGMSSNAQAGHSAYNGVGGPMPSGSAGTAQPRARGQRQVGDWILGKTIGAGSMGKVKVVVHQHTREKVSMMVHSEKGIEIGVWRSVPSRLFPDIPRRRERHPENASIMRKTQPKPLQETPRRKRAPFERRQYRSCFIIPTYAECER